MSAIVIDYDSIQPGIIRKQKKNPDALGIAQNELGAAFNRDNMTLYGRTIRLNDLMREVNKVRQANGVNQVLYNPLWEVK